MPKYSSSMHTGSQAQSLLIRCPTLPLPLQTHLQCVLCFSSPSQGSASIKLHSNCKKSEEASTNKASLSRPAVPRESVSQRQAQQKGSHTSSNYSPTRKIGMSTYVLLLLQCGEATFGGRCVRKSSIIGLIQTIANKSKAYTCKQDHARPTGPNLTASFTGLG